MRQIDEVLLKDIGLPPQVTDLDILETLVERNYKQIYLMLIHRVMEAAVEPRVLAFFGVIGGNPEHQ